MVTIHDTPLTKCTYKVWRGRLAEHRDQSNYIMIIRCVHIPLSVGVTYGFIHQKSPQNSIVFERVIEGNNIFLVALHCQYNWLENLVEKTGIIANYFIINVIWSRSLKLSMANRWIRTSRYHTLHDHCRYVHGICIWWHIISVAQLLGV